MPSLQRSPSWPVLLWSAALTVLAAAAIGWLVRPPSLPAVPFTPEGWRSAGQLPSAQASACARIALAADLVRGGLLVGKSDEQVRALLGSAATQTRLGLCPAHASSSLVLTIEFEPRSGRVAWAGLHPATSATGSVLLVVGLLGLVLGLGSAMVRKRLPRLAGGGVGVMLACLGIWLYGSALDSAGRGFAHVLSARGGVFSRAADPAAFDVSVWLHAALGLFLLGFGVFLLLLLLAGRPVAAEAAGRR